mgnify:CR=1 FL=1
MTGFAYPEISPIMFSIGPLDIRWYSMAYLAGILLGWYLAGRTVKKYDLGLSRENLEDFIFYITIGIIAGGRLGYVLFYGKGMFWENPLSIFEIWQGGMSFHGGILGVILAIFFCARKLKMPFLKLTDLAALYAPIGIFCGRLANFINDELWGRVTNVPWAVRFPNGGYLPRHPSQLYEALFEGLVMFAVLNWLWRYDWVRRRTGFVSALFVLFYGIFRIAMEQFREPDKHMGFFFDYFTMGQILSVPLVATGIIVMWLACRRGKV